MTYSTFIRQTQNKCEHRICDFLECKNIHPALKSLCHSVITFPRLIEWKVIWKKSTTERQSKKDLCPCASNDFILLCQHTFAEVMVIGILWLKYTFNIIMTISYLYRDYLYFDWLYEDTRFSCFSMLVIANKSKIMLEDTSNKYLSFDV